MGERGPPPWEPTDEERRNIEHYVSIGMTQEQIGQVVGKSVDCLVKHCRDELDNGAFKVNAKIGAALFKKAMGGDTAALIWWTKARMRWSERVDVHNQHSGSVALVAGDLPDALGFLAGDGEAIGQGSDAAAG